MDVFQKIVMNKKFVRILNHVIFPLILQVVNEFYAILRKPSEKIQLLTLMPLSFFCMFTLV